MSNTVTITAPILARSDEADHVVLVSKVDLTIKVVSNEAAPVVARKVRITATPAPVVPETDAQLARLRREIAEKADNVPYRAIEGRVYGRRTDTKGRSGTDAVAQLQILGSDIAGDVKRMNAQKEGYPVTRFNDGYFHTDHKHEKGNRGDRFVFVDDCDGDAGLAAAADILRANAAASIVVDDEVHSPCSGPVMTASRFRSDRNGGSLDLRYRYSLESLAVWEIPYHIDLATTIPRVERRKGKIGNIDQHFRVDVIGELPVPEIPVDRLAEAYAARLIYDFRNALPHKIDRQSLRDILALRKTVGRRWPDTEIEWRPFDFTSAFNHIGKSVPDAAELLPHLVALSGSRDLKYSPSEMASLLTVIDYLREREELRADLDEIAEAMAIA